MTLRGSRIRNFDDSWCLGPLGGLEFCVSSTSFQKSNIGWPQQPLTGGVLEFNITFCAILPKFVIIKHESKAKFQKVDDTKVIGSDFPGLRTSATSMT